MSGFLGNDGSALAGGLNPSGVVAGLNLDGSGNLKTVAAGSPSETPVNLNQINGAALANTNPLFIDLVRLLGAALSAANPLPAQLSQGGAVLAASNPLFVAQSQNGAVLSATNPEINISNIQQLILNGQAFNFSTGKVAAAANMAGQFWVPASSSKNVLIWSVRTGYSNANQMEQFDYITAQDTNITAGTNASANALNLKGGGAAPASGATLYYNGGVAGPSGTPLDFLPTPFTTNVELLSSGMFLLIPAGTAGGIAVYSVTTATGSWSFTVRTVEF